MRESRLSGSEGGATHRSSLPLFHLVAFVLAGLFLRNDRGTCFRTSWLPTLAPLRFRPRWNLALSDLGVF